MLIELLASHHDVNSFDCGEESLNQFLQRFALQNQQRDLSRTFVGVPETGSSKVIAYHTLCAHTVAAHVVPVKRLPRYPVPAVLLARLAVARPHQGSGAGRRMLVDALQRGLLAGTQIGAFAIVVDALRPEVVPFYSRFGFQPLLDDPLHLFLPLRTLRDAALDEGA